MIPENDLHFYLNPRHDHYSLYADLIEYQNEYACQVLEWCTENFGEPHQPFNYWSDVEISWKPFIESDKRWTYYFETASTRTLNRKLSVVLNPFEEDGWINLFLRHKEDVAIFRLGLKVTVSKDYTPNASL